ncbi:MAG: arylsulfatase [Chitinophagaceae bacterium]
MRSIFYKYLFLALVIGLFSKDVIAQTTKQPNIIFILADDLGYGDVGCYGQQKIETPHIDQLAAKGKKFTQFYAGTAVCAPSRASLLTGLHTGHTAVRGNKGTKPEGQYPLPDSAITFANILEQNGYTTGAFGKWGLGFITTSGDPAKKGFDQFVGYNCQTLAHNYYPDHLWNNHERIDFPENKTANAVYSADYIQQQAMHFLNGPHDKPFFLYLPYTLPHGDVISPHDSVYNYYVKKFNEPPLPEKVKNDGEVHRFEPYPHAAYATMVDRIDRYVQEIVNSLEKQGIADNTLVIFTSDNGPHRENGGDPEFFNSSGIFRGIKRDLYEGGIREPFIAYWPGTIKPGVSKTIGAFWDMYPSFLELAGIPVTQNIDGISFVPVLLGKKQSSHKYLYWEFHENDGRQAVLWKKWKGVKLGVSKNKEAKLELYDLHKDPSEQNDIASKHRQIVRKIEKQMKEAHVANPDWPLLVGE